MREGSNATTENELLTKNPKLEKETDVAASEWNTISSIGEMMRENLPNLESEDTKQDNTYNISLELQLSLKTMQQTTFVLDLNLAPNQQYDDLPDHIIDPDKTYTLDITDQSNTHPNTRAQLHQHKQYNLYYPTSCSLEININQQNWAKPLMDAPVNYPPSKSLYPNMTEATKYLIEYPPEPIVQHEKNEGKEVGTDGKDQSTSHLNKKRKELPCR